MSITSKLPRISEEETSPLVLELLEIIRLQAEEIQQLRGDNQQLRDEIARLKKHPRRPSIKASQLGKRRRKAGGKDVNGKRPGSEKRRKTEALPIHETRRIAPEVIPEGSTFKGCTTYTVQDFCIHAHNIRYELEQWETPEGDYVVGKLPQSVQESHFGPTLVGFILYQYYHAHVTQPRLLEQLHEYGIEISAGQLSRVLTERKESFHDEKAALLAVGLQVSPYVQVDDTGARHQGRNGYCTQIGNEWFAWFESTQSKSRLNFLRCLRAGRTAVALQPEAFAYMEAQRLPRQWLAVLGEFAGKVFVDESAWEEFLPQIGLTTPSHVQIATEGALLGGVVRSGIAPNLVILSDGASQFAIFLHALCWIHAERSLTTMILTTEQEHEALETIRSHFWKLYDDLSAYKQCPDAGQKVELSARFDEMFTSTTCSEALNQVLTRLHGHKNELLRVLEYPEIPLHNNGSEQAIREYVTRRKISGGTRSEEGRRCRDTFTSLKKTCRKLKISFWQSLLDRLGHHGTLPPLATLIEQHARSPG